MGLTWTSNARHQRNLQFAGERVENPGQRQQKRRKKGDSPESRRKKWLVGFGHWGKGSYQKKQKKRKGGKRKKNR